MKKYPIHLQSFNQIEKRRWLLIVVLVATIHLCCQTLILPYGTALLSLLPGHENALYFTRTSSSSTLEDELQEENLEFVEDLDLGDIYLEDNNNLETEDISNSLRNEVTVSNISNEEVKPEIMMVNNISSVIEPAINNSVAGLRDFVLPINEKYDLFHSDGSKKMRCLMPPKSVMYNDQMNRLLARNRRSSRAMLCRGHDGLRPGTKKFLIQRYKLQMHPPECPIKNFTLLFSVMYQCSKEVMSLWNVRLKYTYTERARNRFFINRY